MKSFILGIGISYTSLILVQHLLPEDYSAAKIGGVGMLFIGLGVVGGLIGSVYTEKKKDAGNYDPIIKMFIFFAFISMVRNTNFLLK